MRGVGTMLGFLQRIGRALMLPIAVLPAAGLLLRFGQDDLLDVPFLVASGNAIFGHLALLFAIGVAVGLSRDGSGAAGLAGAIGYFVLTEGAKTFAEVNLNYDGKFDMSVLGGILAGVIAGLLYNKFYNTKLPEWLSFFGGKRFVPIVTAGTMVLLALVFGFIWPYLQMMLENVGTWITSAGAIGAGIFGFFNRLLIPLGLHHVLNSFLWFVFGEFTGENGKVFTGDLSRFFAGDPKAGFYMAGFFPVMMFGLPAACLAMIHTAKKHRKKAVAGMLGSLALTSFVTGITEPIEFAFMFLSPLLYVIHAVLTAVSMSVAVLLDIHHGFTFSAGAIDYFLNIGISQNGWLLLPMGAVYFVLYYAIFRYLIVKLNLKTPGREDEEAIVSEAAATSTASEKYETAASAYLSALGGKDNIVLLENCITRLRVQIKDFSEVDEEALKKAGSKGLIKLNNQNIQVVVGSEVEPIADCMRDKL